MFRRRPGRPETSYIRSIYVFCPGRIRFIFDIIFYAGAQLKDKEVSINPTLLDHFKFFFFFIIFLCQSSFTFPFSILLNGLLLIYKLNIAKRQIQFIFLNIIFHDVIDILFRLSFVSAKYYFNEHHFCKDKDLKCPPRNVNSTYTRLDFVKEVNRVFIISQVCNIVTLQ